MATMDLAYLQALGVIRLSAQPILLKVAATERVCVQSRQSSQGANGKQAPATSASSGTYSKVCRQVVFLLSDAGLRKNNQLRTSVQLAEQGWLDVGSTIATIPSVKESLDKCGSAFDLSAFCQDLAVCAELEVQKGEVRRVAPYQVADGPCSSFPAEFAAAKFAGVLVVGQSSQHGGVAAALLGGRLFRAKQIYEYNDFGGGIDKKEQALGHHHIAAFREFVEELLALEGEDARQTAEALWHDTRASLLDGGPLLHTSSGGRYLQFIVPAEAVLASSHLAARLPSRPVKEGASAIDLLFAAGVQSFELTSLALVSLDELLRGALVDGVVSPLAVRSLDGEDHSSGSIKLRGASKGDCMVGHVGSIAACARRLRGFERLYTEIAARPLGSHRRMPMIFDMEMGDPDDVLTLLFICAHPSIELKAVTITPGSRGQVSLARWILNELGLLHVRLGAEDWPKNFDKKGPKEEGGFYSHFGRMETDKKDCEPASLVLLECCDGATTLVTGAQMHNLAAALALDGFRLGRLVAQGGFAGEGVVPRHLQMEKFAGLQFCSTWNFGGNIPAAASALSSPAIGRRVCVSKNVCHRTTYDATWHSAVAAAIQRAEAHGDRCRVRAFCLMYQAMDEYLAHKPEGKKIHDPLALAVAIDESVVVLREVVVECKKGQWGSRLAAGTSTWISIDYNEAKFKAALLQIDAL